MLGLWLWLELTLPKTLTLTLDPNPQNGIVEGHPHQIRTLKKTLPGVLTIGIATLRST